jgi:hypothetical protein
MLPNDRSVDLAMEIGVMTVVVAVAVALLAAIALPAPQIAKAMAASLTPWAVKREYLFILLFLRFWINGLRGELLVVQTNDISTRKPYYFPGGIVLLFCKEIITTI